MRWVHETPSLRPQGCLDQIQADGLRLPPCFAVAPEALAGFLQATGLFDSLREKLSRVDVTNPDSVMLACFSAREEILQVSFPEALRNEIAVAYSGLSKAADLAEALVTVRPWGGSTHEGGRYRGLSAICRALATAFSDHLTRAVTQEGVTDLRALSASAPRWVVSQAFGWRCSGIVTNFDPRSRAEEFVVVLSTWGLAEDIARKELARDEFVVHKARLRDGFRALVRSRAGQKEFSLDFDISAGRMRHSEVLPERVRELSLTPDEVLSLARAALAFDGSVEIDWGMEQGWSRQLYLLGAREQLLPKPRLLRLYRIDSHGESLVEGKAVGTGVAVGQVRVIERSQELDSLLPGEILVTRKTEPDWEPAFRRAGGLVTEQDTRVSHSTILARELGIPALLQSQGSVQLLKTGQTVTLSCCQGEVGHLYQGAAAFTVEEFNPTQRLPLKTELMVNLSMPEQALEQSRLPWSGAGLVRSEFLLSGWVRIHPLALCFPQRLPPEVQKTVHRLCRGHSSPQQYFIDQMSQALSTVASAFWPRPAVLRLSDLKSHEYQKLVGGERFEPPEANPVLGFRGAARYTHPDYQPAFELELAAIRKVRQEMGFSNLQLMVPFCRTPEEGEAVLELLAEAGLVQGREGLEVSMMAELPSNVFLAEQFAELFDGFSIGSNDLTQLTLGVDRDNTRVAELFDELDPALMACYQQLIEAAHHAGKKVSFCGQIASDDPMMAATLAEMGIDAISVTPDAFHRTLEALQS